MRTMRVVAAGLVVTVGFGLAGCGKSKSSGSPASSKPTVEAYDFRFDPTAITVKSGQVVTLTFKNEGKAEHNFSISSLAVNQDLEAGKDATVTFTAPAAGDVQFFCEYHKDSKGMTGTLHVT